MILRRAETRGQSPALPAWPRGGTGQGDGLTFPEKKRPRRVCPVNGDRRLLAVGAAAQFGVSLGSQRNFYRQGCA